MTYLAGNTGTADAAYKYDPFGRTLASTGGYAAANVCRFSSKALHAPSGLYYYGYRFYDPNTQRWLNRDVLQERFDRNLYRFNYSKGQMALDFSVRIPRAFMHDTHTTSPCKWLPLGITAAGS